MKKNTFYVTTPIYYVTAAPHLGSLYSTLLADVAARYHKIMGKEVFFLTGTDEHGQKVAEAAAKAGKNPQEFVDGFISSYVDTWKLYNIEYDKFIRTTDKEHVKAVQHWIERLMEQGDIYKSEYVGWYCTPCETYVTDKDITPDAVEVACPSCLRPTGKLAEESYFFRLSKYQDRLLELYREHAHLVTPKERLQEVINFVKDGLKDLSISRTTVTWGIPFPGDDKHVTYVWADALNNYITAIGYGTAGKETEFKHWWPADMQILGKDIVRFHAVFWPAFLMATGLEIPKTLLVHGWLKIGDQKMSKSLGNAIDPVSLANRYGVDSIRYYLTRKMAITQDSQFSLDDIEQSINSELANDLGNLLNRCIVLAEKNEYTSIQLPATLSDKAANLQQQCDRMIAEAVELIESGYFYRGVNRIWEYVHQVNAYMQLVEPWRLAKTDRAAFEEAIAVVAYSLRTIGIMLWPVMPSKMDQLLQSLNYTLQPAVQHNLIAQHGAWTGNISLKLQNTLFQKYEKPAEEIVVKEEQAVSTPSYISIDDFVKVDIRVGLIEQAEAVEKSDKLIKMQVNFGELGKRQILSGVRKFIQPESLVGKKGIFVVNFAPRMMLGMPSEGMMLTAESNGVLSILQPSAEIEPGAKLK